MSLSPFWASLVAQLIKNPPAMWETWVRSLGWEDPLEKEMEIHSSTIAWKIPWTEEPDTLQSAAAAAAAKSLQSCPTLCSPMDCSLLGSSVSGDSPGKNTGVGCHALLQGIFPTQALNLSLPHCRQILYHLSHQGSPFLLAVLSVFSHVVWYCY